MGQLHDVQIFTNGPMSRENYVGLFLGLDCGFYWHMERKQCEKRAKENLPDLIMHASIDSIFLCARW